MNESLQLSLFSRRKPRGRVEYRSPPVQDADRFAYDVCQAFEMKYGEPCTSTEFVQGFRAFVHTIVNAQTKLLNKGRKI